MREKLVWWCFLAVTSAACASPNDCPIQSSTQIVVPAGTECPSLGEAQAKLDAGNHLPDEKVMRFEEMRSQPAGTMCWYRMEMDDECIEPSRASLSSGSFPGRSKVACDVDGWLYGEPSPGGAGECAASIMPKTPVLPFVGADDYPARDECLYETSFPAPCGTIPGVGYGGLK